ncbi:MAG: tRNA-dihydrouridine synthase [Thermoproteota archaeon]|jgi:tRNA-dihydrouridine synthase
MSPSLSSLSPIKAGSLFFAPMEGVTNPVYRQLLIDHYNEWDYFACDFLRIPSVGIYPNRHIYKHYGKDHFQKKSSQDKTIYQILTSDNALTAQSVKQINDLGAPWLDINFGCPSKTVVKNKGGSFILSEPEILKRILTQARENFKGRLTAKIRVGFKDDKLFEQNIKLIEDCGIDALIIHGRTREELYKGKANWSYIKKATSLLSIPVIGNGDVWNVSDIHRILDETKCHSVMIARGAMKTPWLAKLYKDNEIEKMSDRKERIRFYFNTYHQYLLSDGYPEYGTLKRFKNLSRYIFDDFKNAPEVKRHCLRSINLAQFNKGIDSLKV